MNLRTLTKLGRLTGYIARHQKYFWWGLAVTLLTNGIAMLSPWIMKLVIDRLKAGTIAVGELRNFALLILALALTAGVCMFYMRRTIIWSSRIIEYELRNDFFRHLLTLPKSFYQTISTGDIVARSSNDMEAIRMLIGPAIMQAANAIFSVSVALVMMLALSWKLTLISLTMLPLLSILMHKLGTSIHKKFFRIQEHFSNMSGFVQENISGAKVVKAYNQEPSQIEEFADLNRTYVDLNLALARIRGIFFPAIFLVAGTIVLLLTYFGGLQVMQGNITLGTLVAFIFYLMNLIWPMLAFGWVISLYQRGTASEERIEKILDQVSEVADGPQTSDAGIGAGEIEIRNLSFTYPNATTPTLKNVSLHIPAHGTVAIVGPTGCGKTTLVNLLVRTFKVSDGRILIDGIDINRMPLARLRSEIGYVPQETFLFSDTLTENIAFGVEQATAERVIEAAEVAGIRAEIEEFPQKFETIIGERGVTISGGQKQRTSLARAILKQPPVLILDDAFSSVDTHTEDLILGRLGNVLQGRTSIIISHRISTIRNADLIFVMEDGRITAQGRHEELLARSELYARIVKLQSLREELESIA